jgi:hypothetical protein
MSLIYVFIQKYPSPVGRDIPGYPVLSYPKLGPKSHLSAVRGLVSRWELQHKNFTGRKPETGQ